MKCGRYLLRFFLACGLAMGKTRVSARVGREGEMADLFEQPDCRRSSTRDLAHAGE